MSLRKRRKQPKLLKLNTEFTPSQIAELQYALEALRQDARWRNKVIVLPPGRRT